MKLKIVLTTLVFIIMCGVFYHVNTMQNDPMQVIALIKKNINPKDGSIMDYAGDINFRGLDSVGYAHVDDDTLRIFFGDLQFDLEQDVINTDEMRTQLKAIGITLRQDKKTKKVIVQYRGEDVNERKPER